MHAAMRILYTGGSENLREDLAGRLEDPCTRDASRFKYMLAPDYRDVRNGLPVEYRERYDGRLPRCMENHWRLWRTGAVGMDSQGIRNTALAFRGMIVRPGATLCSISENPGGYLVSALTVFAALIVTGILLIPSHIALPTVGATWHYSLYSQTAGTLGALLFIAGIFWIGRIWGGNRSFRKAFPVLSHCLIPGVLGISATAAAAHLHDVAFPVFAFPDGLHIAAGYGIYHMLQNTVGIFFIGWILLLQMKAIRTLNGFGYARSAAILVLGILILYAEGRARGLILGTFSESMLW